MADTLPPAGRGRFDDLVDAEPLDLAVQACRLAPADFRRLVFGVARSVDRMLAEYAALEPDDAVTLARRIATGGALRSPCCPGDAAMGFVRKAGCRSVRALVAGPHNVRSSVYEQLLVPHQFQASCNWSRISGVEQPHWIAKRSGPSCCTFRIVM